MRTASGPLWAAIVAIGTSLPFTRATEIVAFGVKQSSLPPEIFEPRRRQLGVSDGMLDIAMPEVRL
jgi:hypothetical protein